MLTIWQPSRNFVRRLRDHFGMRNATITATVIITVISKSSSCCYEVADARQRRRIPGLLHGIGPELAAGASDNDPTNVGTAVTVGAASGYRPVARSDLQTLTLKRYGRGAAAAPLISVVVVTVVTVAADLHAGAARIVLLAGVRACWFVLPLGPALTGLLLVARYNVVRVFVTQTGISLLDTLIRHVGGGQRERGIGHTTGPGDPGPP